MYTITFIPWITVEGDVAEIPFQDQYHPELVFDLSEDQLYLNPSYAASSDEDPVNPTSPGLIPRTQPVPNSISIFGPDVPVITARWVSVIAIVLAIAGFSALYYLSYKSSQGGPTAAAKLDYGKIMIDIEEWDRPQGVTITVDSLSDLAKIAAANSQLILH